MKMMDLNFKIQYKKGITNAVADALSRCPDPESIFAISTNERLQEGYLEDPMAKQLLFELAVVSENDQGYKLVNGIIYFQERIWVGNNVLAQQNIVQALHASGIGGHFGIQATYHRIKCLFAQPSLKQTVIAYVQACEICQKAKGEHVKLPGLLQPLLVPSRAWTMITMDFVEGLPKSEGADVILVVIDKFSKYGHFIALSHPYTTLQVAKLFFNNV